MTTMRSMQGPLSGVDFILNLPLKERSIEYLPADVRNIQATARMLKVKGMIELPGGVDHANSSSIAEWRGGDRCCGWC
jgi:hypothetical protein